MHIIIIVFQFRSHGLLHTKVPCPSLSPGVCSNSCPLNQRCHPTISFIIIFLKSVQIFGVSWDIFILTIIHTCVLSCFSYGQLFCDPKNCSPPGSSVHGILQARILEWVATLFLQGVFLTQGSNPRLLCLLQRQAGSLPLASPGKSNIIHTALYKSKQCSIVTWLTYSLRLGAFVFCFIN